MQRFGMTRLKPGSQAAFKEYHAAVWPRSRERKLPNATPRTYSIFLKDGVLFGYFEYHGSGVDEDWAKMASDPKTQEGWAVMNPLQEPRSVQARKASGGQPWRRFFIWIKRLRARA